MGPFSEFITATQPCQKNSVLFQAPLCVGPMESLFIVTFFFFFNLKGHLKSEANSYILATFTLLIKINVVLDVKRTL